MIVEDDGAFRGWLTAVLRNAGHEMVAAESAEGAMECMGRVTPDLVLMDVMLPGLSGFDLVAELRARDATANLPVIFISALGQRHFVRQGMELGADDFITKPVSADEVIRSIETRLRRAGCAAATPPRAGAPQAVTPVGGGEEIAAGEPPRRINRFVLGRKLGGSDVGDVYLGRDPDTGREAAVKILRHPGARQSAAVSRYMREIALASQLRHPNLAAILDHGVVEEKAFVAFEYFPFGDLEGVAARGISTNLACRVIVHVATGLRTLHENGIAHLGIKPANIMARGPSDFALTDFGAAKLRRGGQLVNRSGLWNEPPTYLAPEQILGKPAGPPADIYSIGMVFYRLLTGCLPFEGANYRALLARHQDAAPPPLPQGFAAFQPVLDRLLAIRSAARYTNAREVVAAVNAIA